MSKSESSSRRGPGRPPRIVTPSAPIHGIVDSPTNPSNIIELSYFDPIVFKYLFTLLKNLKVRDIYFKFSKKSITIYTKDNINNRIKISIDSKKMLNYYCKDDNTYICINRDNIQAVFINLNKTIDKISICLEQGNDMITIMLHDNNLDKVKRRFIIISEKIPSEELLSLDKDIDDISTSAPLSFSLTTRDFKDTISDATNYGDKITIEKHGDGPLVLKFIRAHTNICAEEYNDNNKIDLTSELEDDESFICTLHTLLLKCISVSIVNNKVNIKCIGENKAMLSSNIGDVISFTIIAENLTHVYN
uniref:Proliferating cell nuclear antigen PCNA N-terminal domain-containing protein n=1 Tax=viral metagenome TaxID=1070528 RepID=A0A6C0LKP3_9ZZZZ